MDTCQSLSLFYVLSQNLFLNEWHFANTLSWISSPNFITRNNHIIRDNCSCSNDGLFMDGSMPNSRTHADKSSIIYSSSLKCCIRANKNMIPNCGLSRNMNSILQYGILTDFYWKEPNNSCTIPNGWFGANRDVTDHDCIGSNKVSLIQLRSVILMSDSTQTRDKSVFWCVGSLDLST